MIRTIQNVYFCIINENYVVYLALGKLAKLYEDKRATEIYNKNQARLFPMIEQDWAVAVTLALDIKEVNTSPSFGITIIKGLGKPR